MPPPPRPRFRFPRFPRRRFRRRPFFQPIIYTTPTYYADECPPGTVPYIVDGVLVECRPQVVVAERTCPPGTYWSGGSILQPDGSVKQEWSCRPPARALGAVPETAFGVITWPGGSYQLTPTDVLWAARAAAHEGVRSVHATLWAWTQRYTLPNMHRRFATLAEMVQFHSQPVHPGWQRGGEFCRPGGRGYRMLRPDGSHSCTEEALDRRARARTMSWESIGSGVRNTVLRWATARLPNPVPGATDFAASWARVSSRFTRLYDIGGNAFYAEGGSESWPRDHVKIVAGNRVAEAGEDGIGASLLFGVAGAAAFFVGRAIASRA